MDISYEKWQNISPQNMALWHKDYCELKALKKQHIQEGHSSLSFNNCKQEMKTHVKDILPEQEKNAFFNRVKVERILYKRTLLK